MESSAKAALEITEKMNSKVVEISLDDEGEEEGEEEEEESEDENDPKQSTKKRENDHYENYAATFDEMIDRVVDDYSIVDRVYFKYEVDEEDAIAALVSAGRQF